MHISLVAEDIWMFQDCVPLFNTCVVFWYYDLFLLTIPILLSSMFPVVLDLLTNLFIVDLLQAFFLSNFSQNLCPRSLVK
jgi:hypothetical protein